MEKLIFIEHLFPDTRYFTILNPHNNPKAWFHFTDSTMRFSEVRQWRLSRCSPYLTGWHKRWRTSLAQSFRGFTSSWSQESLKWQWEPVLQEPERTTTSHLLPLARPHNLQNSSTNWWTTNTWETFLSNVCWNTKFIGSRVKWRLVFKTQVKTKAQPTNSLFRRKTADHRHLKQSCGHRRRCILLRWVNIERNYQEVVYLGLLLPNPRSYWKAGVLRWVP